MIFNRVVLFSLLLISPLSVIGCEILVEKYREPRLQPQGQGFAGFPVRGARFDAHTLYESSKKPSLRSPLSILVMKSRAGQAEKAAVAAADFEKKNAAAQKQREIQKKPKKQTVFVGTVKPQELFTKKQKQVAKEELDGVLKKLSAAHELGGGDFSTWDTAEMARMLSLPCEKCSNNRPIGNRTLVECIQLINQGDEYAKIETGRDLARRIVRAAKVSKKAVQFSPILGRTCYDFELNEE